MIPKGYCVGIPWQRADNDPSWYDIAIDKLNPHFWINWKYDQANRNGNVPVLWRCDTKSVHDALPAATTMGERFWILGNEPDLEKQSNTPPADFVDAAIMWRELVGGEIGLPGVYWDHFEHGRKWVEEYIRLGGPLPDAWTVHFYQPISRMWINNFYDMLDFFRGIANLPILLTECGCSYGEDELIYGVMEQARKAVRVGDVRASFWFSVYYELDMPWNNLLTYDGELTQWGDLWNRHRVDVYLPNTTRDDKL